MQWGVNVGELLIPVTLQVVPVIIIQLAAITNANAPSYRELLETVLAWSEHRRFFQDRFNEPDSPLKRNYFDERELAVNFPTKILIGRMILSQIFI